MTDDFSHLLTFLQNFCKRITFGSCVGGLRSDKKVCFFVSSQYISNCLSLKGFLKVMELHLFSNFRPLFYTEVFASFGQIIAKSRNERILSKYIDFGLWISRFTILTSLYVYISSTLYYDIVKIHHTYLASKGKGLQLQK